MTILCTNIENISWHACFNLHISIFCVKFWSLKMKCRQGDYMLIGCCETLVFSIKISMFYIWQFCVQTLRTLVDMCSKLTFIININQITYFNLLCKILKSENEMQTRWLHAHWMLWDVTWNEVVMDFWKK
jgi:hypothetical protein